MGSADLGRRNVLCSICNGKLPQKVRWKTYDTIHKKKSFCSHIHGVLEFITPALRKFKAALGIAMNLRRTAWATK